MKKQALFLTLLFAGLSLFPKLPFAAAPEKSTIKLRVVAVNPSKDKSQAVPIKIYLPKEVIPDDIIEMGELQVGYDSTKGVYYAFSEGVELKPQEARVFEVHLEDVWKVKSEEMEKLRNQTNLALKHLETTPHASAAQVIVESIGRRLTEITVKQEDVTISREEHIGAYRVNLMMMDQIKQDVKMLEKMLQASGVAPAIEFLKDAELEKKDDISKITAWKLIFAIIAGIALLGAGFYVRWFFALRMKRRSAEEMLPDAPMISEHVEEHVGFGDKPSKKAV